MLTCFGWAGEAQISEETNMTDTVTVTVNHWHKMEALCLQKDTGENRVHKPRKTVLSHEMGILLWNVKMWIRPVYACHSMVCLKRESSVWKSESANQPRWQEPYCLKCACVERTNSWPHIVQCLYIEADYQYLWFSGETSPWNSISYIPHMLRNSGNLAVKLHN